MLTKLPTEDFHRRNAVEFVDIPEFGLSLPATYGSAADEYQALRHRSALLDLSHHGRLRLAGKDALDLMHRLSTNDVRTLKPGTSIKTVLTNEKARIIDRVTMAHMGDHFLIVTSPQNQDRVAAWLDRYVIMEDVTVEDISSTTAHVAIAGPSAVADSSRIIGGDGKTSLTIEEARGFFSDIMNDTAVELIAPAANHVSLFKHLAELPLCGYHALTQAEAENLQPSSPWELNEQSNPLEAGLSNLVSFTKGCYIGQEVIARLDSQQKVHKKLCLLSVSTIITEGDKRLFFNNKEIGALTRVFPPFGSGLKLAFGFVKYEFIASDRVFTLGGPSSENHVKLLRVCP